MRVRRCIEIRDGERVIVAAHDVPGRGHGEVRLEQQEATGEREPGRMRRIRNRRRLALIEDEFWQEEGRGDKVRAKLGESSS